MKLWKFSNFNKKEIEDFKNFQFITSMKDGYLKWDFVDMTNYIHDKC
ncbi:MAG: hypothetical protein R3E32_03775 [Chitinophagales bacterium]